MLPLGRRRAGSLTPLALCLALVLLFASTASAAVLGIDFGTLNIKAALVKPGTPLDIVLTKDSKRKEVAAVAFKPNRDEKNKIITEEGTFPERAYGGDALSLQGRLPGEVFPNLKLLLGLQPGDEGDKVAQIYRSRYPALQMESAADLGTTVFKSSAFAEGAAPFSVEELVGMELANIRRNAELMAGKGSVVEHAVITIPAFYTADEKRALIKAAGLAGLTVDALISDGMAVGLEYAKTRTFPEITKDESPEYHLVYDMGAGSATATLMRFQSRSVKDVGRKNKTVQEVAVVGAGWDRTLGGDALNTVIVDNFVDQLLAKSDVKSRGTSREEITSNGRLMGRFFKDAEKARHILSANTETSNGFEEILPDVDLRTKLTRAQFEKMTAEFADRVDKPITDALAMAKLSIKDLTSLIVHGGAVRTPFVQSKLESLVGTGKIRSSVNPDEAAVFGAAFKAATLSPSFKVKEIRDSDLAGYITSLKYTDKDKERKQQLFTPSSPVGWGATTKQVTFKDKEDFSFGFVQTVGDVDRPIITVKSENLTASVQELVTKYGCEKDEIVTKFGVRLGSQFGLPEVSGGTVSCEVDDSKSGSVGDSVKGWLGFGKKKDQEPLEDGESDGPVEELDASTSASSSTSTAASTSSDAASPSKSPEPPKKRMETLQVRVSTSSEGGARSDQDFLGRSSDRLKAFDDSDNARYARDEAQNVLEAYTYSVRDFLENRDYDSFSTATLREEISKLLQSTRDWMESGDISKATTEILKEKRTALKNLVEPIKTRKTEESKRPALIKSLQKSLDDTQKLILKVQGEAEKASSSVASALSSMASTTSSASASPSSDADDLDEPESSSVVEAPPTPTNAYANLNFDKVQETYDSISKWLISTTAEQKKLKSDEEPVLLVRDLESKAKEMGTAMKAFSAAAKEARKPPKPAPKPKAKPTKKATKSAAKEAATDIPVGGDDEEVRIPKKGEEGYEEFERGYEQFKQDKFREFSMDDILKMAKGGKDGETADDTVVHEEL